MVTYPWKIAALTGPSGALVLIDITAAAIAVSHIRGSFGTTEAQGALVTYLYIAGILLAHAAEGYLSRRYGTRRVWLAGQAGFIATSLLTALAQDMESFLVGRILQGVAAGLLQPVSLSLALATTARSARLALLAILTLTFASPLLGLPLGGFLSQSAEWRLLFLLNVPLGALLLLFGLHWLRETPTDPTTRFDWVGWLLLGLIFVALVLGVADVANSGWRWILQPFELRMLATAALLLPLLIWWELRARDPLLDLRLFALPRFWHGVLLCWVALIQISGIITLWLSFLRNPLLYGLGVQSTGALVAWAAMGFLVAFPPALIVLGRFGLRPVLGSGFILLLCTYWTLRVLDVGIARRTIEITLFLQGMGIGFTLFPGIVALTQAIPPARQIPAAGMIAFFVRLIPAANIAIVNTFLNLRQYVSYGHLAMQVSPARAGVEVGGTSPEMLAILVQRTAYVLAIEDTWRFLLLTTAVVGLLLSLTLRQERIALDEHERPAVRRTPLQRHRPGQRHLNRRYGFPRSSGRWRTLDALSCWR